MLCARWAVRIITCLLFPSIVMPATRQIAFCFVYGYVWVCHGVSMVPKIAGWFFFWIVCLATKLSNDIYGLPLFWSSYIAMGQPCLVVHATIFNNLLKSCVSKLERQHSMVSPFSLLTHHFPQKMQLGTWGVHFLHGWSIAKKASGLFLAPGITCWTFEPKLGSLNTRFEDWKYGMVWLYRATSAYFKNTGVVGIVSMYLSSRYPLLGLAFWLVM